MEPLPFQQLLFLLAGLLLLAAMVSIVHAHYALIGCKLGMMSRIMSTSAIYRKVKPAASHIS